MSEANLRQIRVLHIVGSGAVASGLQQSLLMPLLTRLPKQRAKIQVAALAPGVVPAAVLRLNGVPVHDVSLSRRRFSFSGYSALLKVVKAFRPDVIQAWGYTAQIVSSALRKRCEWQPKLVWSIAHTVPLARNAGMIDRRKVKYAAKLASAADRIVYASEAGAVQHRRVGFPEDECVTIPPGVDATRFKPDAAARNKIREQLQLAPEAFVIGMVAPFQPEYDHATFLKAAGELSKSQPNLAVVLAGHGMQKGNAPLMALVGGGTLGTRTQLLGEWSDLASLFNACDVVCSSALNDSSRMTLAAAMLCGVPCVATGMGAQGEIIGQFGIAIEPGSPAAFIKGITRILQLPIEKRASMAHGARKHALKNYVYVRSLQSYLQLYYELIGRQALVVQDVPMPQVDASVPVPAKAGAPPPRKPAVTIAELADPDSLEEKVTEHASLPKWRLEQEEERARRERELQQHIASTQTGGDVLQVFEAELAKPAKEAIAPLSERARGVAEEVEELLPMAMLAAPLVPSRPVASPGQGAMANAAQSACADPVVQPAASIAQPAKASAAGESPAARSSPAVAEALDDTGGQSKPVRDQLRDVSELAGDTEEDQLASCDADTIKTTIIQPQAELALLESSQAPTQLALLEPNSDAPCQGHAQQLDLLPPSADEPKRAVAGST